MSRILALPLLFRMTAFLELGYMLLGLLPPFILEGITGWDLTADGHWVTKLLAVSLGAQAWIAWQLRDKPTLSVARGLAFYQVASATVDWLMWIALSDHGIFSNPTSKVIVSAAILTHYALGLLLIVTIRRAGRENPVAP
ncbi:hypothetical protein [Streptomyces sp. NPDC060002]|uniref:hypothetical protein n=1 Tax=Streptomyces sp. NPDC060002 TaxID=3347033 RepID=UPI0036BAC7A4